MKEIPRESSSDLQVRLHNAIGDEPGIQSLSLVKDGRIILQKPRISQPQFNDAKGEHRFVVTDELCGTWYLVTDRGSDYELMIPIEDGNIQVSVDPEADLVSVADRLLNAFRIR